jgi:hypothetical protein
VICYTDAYKDAGRNKQAVYAAIGWAIWIVIYLAALSASDSDNGY